MPFIQITAAMDKAAKRGVGSSAFLQRTIQAWRRRGRRGWVYVRSSWIAAFRFNLERETFDIRVKKKNGSKEGGKEYRDYPDLSVEKVKNLLRLRSAGRWMWRYYPPMNRGKRLRGRES